MGESYLSKTPEYAPVATSAYDYLGSAIRSYRSVPMSQDQFDIRIAYPHVAAALTLDFLLYDELYGHTVVCVNSGYSDGARYLVQYRDAGYHTMTLVQE